MKRVLLISVAVTLVALTGCIYSPATYEPTVEEQAAMEVFANDSTVTLDTVQCIVLEKINPDWKQLYIDTLDNFLSLPLAGGTVQDTLGHAVVVPGSAEKYRIEVEGDYLAAYAKLDVPANAQYDIYLDIHGTVTIWDDSGRMRGDATATG
ncbi:MAG: hypothetical protein U5N26_11240 [Candidatus Marinimicrobia bacterium]|nr:hypothetical protein [Candidatus Neomarinimicrobiota bacterium]